MSCRNLFDLFDEISNNLYCRKFVRRSKLIQVVVRIDQLWQNNELIDPERI